MIITFCPWCNRAPIEEGQKTCNEGECRRRESRLGPEYRAQIGWEKPTTVEVPDPVS